MKEWSVGSGGARSVAIVLFVGRVSAVGCVEVEGGGREVGRVGGEGWEWGY